MSCSERKLQGFGRATSTIPHTRGSSTEKYAQGTPSSYLFLNFQYAVLFKVQKNSIDLGFIA